MWQLGLNFPSVTLVLLVVSSFHCHVFCETTGNASVIDDNEMGLEVLYDMVNTFLGDIVQREKISDSFLNLSTLIKNGHFDDDQLTDWNSWADYLMGYSVCVGLGLLFIVAMPIAGLIFCCCRMCSKCGAQKKIYESRRAKCKRGCYCTTLLILNTVTLLGVVCAFLSNAALYEHLQNEEDQGIVGNMKSAIVNLDSYVDNTVQDATHFIYESFNTISHDVLNQIDESADHAVDSVLAAINVTQYMNEAKDISAEANATKDELETVSTLLGQLQTQSDGLRTNLTKIRDDIAGSCTVAGAVCTGFDPTKYDTKANFSSLGSLKNETEEVSKSLGMTQDLQQAEANIEREKSKARDDVQAQIQLASESIESVNNSVTKGIRDLRQKKDEALDFVPDTLSSLDDLNDDIHKYDDYIYYAGLGVGCVYLLVVTFYYVGLLFGLCGEKPGEGAPCCNTGAGAGFLMGGVALTFLFSWLLMLLCVLMFISGGPAYTEVCRYFITHDPSQFEVFDVTLRDGFDFFGNFSPTFSLSQSIRDCQENKALYSSLELDSYVNLNDTLNTQDVVRALDDLKNTEVKLGNITVISEDLQTRLGDLASAGLDNINFTEYFVQANMVRMALTETDLNTLANITDGLADLSSEPAKGQLYQSATDLRELHTQTIVPMRQVVNQLDTTLQQLQSRSTISTRVQKLSADLMNAQTTFNTHKDQLIKDEIVALANTIIQSINTALDGLKEDIRKNKFPCGPLSASLYQLTDSICVLGVDPLNGMWFSYGWCLILFIPCLIFAVLLASQYRREHEYDKDLDDPRMDW